MLCLRDLFQVVFELKKQGNELNKRSLEVEDRVSCNHRVERKAKYGNCICTVGCNFLFGGRRFIILVCLFKLLCLCTAEYLCGSFTG